MRNSNADNLLLSTERVAALLSISRSNFYGLLSSGRIGPEPIYLGRRVLWKRVELESWIAADCPPRHQWLSIKKAEQILV